MAAGCISKLGKTGLMGPSKAWDRDIIFPQNLAPFLKMGSPKTLI